MINKNQEIIVKNAQTPAAVIAGPGTGKTYTIVKRVIHLIEKENIDPNRIVITSFTKKAANELVERIEEELKKRDIKMDSSNMMIGNFHSLALGFLRDYKSFDKSIFSPIVVDTSMEGYLTEKNLSNYKKIDGFEKYCGKKYQNVIFDIFAEITNNLIDVEKLKTSDDPKDRFAARIYEYHWNFLEKNGYINYQMILKKFYDLLNDDYYGNLIRSRIDYVIIDEYQDTNRIQEEIGFKLVKDKNIMVFGDDDQSLYSFRGADVKNLLNFDEVCKEKLGYKAHIYGLDINYRSNQAILDKASSWIKSEDIWENSFEKNLRSNDNNYNDSSVVRAKSENFSNILKIIRLLEKKVNLNQIAFLFPSLNSGYPTRLQAYLEKSGIKVLNKSGEKFFYRKEIRLILYILLNIFSKEPVQTEGTSDDYLLKRQQTEFKEYIVEIFKDEEFVNDENLNEFVEEIKKIDDNLSYSDIIYRAFSCKALEEILGKDLHEMNEIRSVKNVSKFLDVTISYENLYLEKDISYKKMSIDFFYMYIFYLFRKKSVLELEDVDNISDAINFMTIHKSKGLEFDVVFTSALFDKPRENKAGFFKKENNDPNEKLRDFYRKYFTAFTRAKKLCVILDNSDDLRLKKFGESFPDSSILKSLDFVRDKKEVDKPILAYTTDISLYESCPVKYKFLRKFSFGQKNSKATLFGSRTHELVEYITKSKKSDTIYDILRENPKYASPIENFLKRDFNISQSETNFKTDRDFYILQGNIDIILDDDSIIDIKTGKEHKENFKKYEKQLLSYNNLMLENYRKPKSLFIYYIEEDKLLEVPNGDFDIKEIDEISKKIIEEKFEPKTSDLAECKFCPMKYYCKRSWLLSTLQYNTVKVILW